MTALTITRDYLNTDNTPYTGLRAILCNGGSFTPTDPSPLKMYEFIRYELAQGLGGYSRFALSVNTDTYDSTNKRRKVTFNAASMTATAAFTFDTVVVASTAVTTANAIVTLTAGTGKVNYTAHGLAADTPVVFTADSGGALPATITAGTQYFVRSPTTNDFSIATTAGGTAIASFASAGTAPIRLRIATGTSYWFYPFGSTAVANGAVLTLNLSFSEGGANATINAA